MRKKKHYIGYKKAVPEHVKVIAIEKPGEFESEIRYIIIDGDTGEVFDDAQGFGYKTSQKAYAAFRYKIKSPSEHAALEKKKRDVQHWCKTYSSVVKLLEAIQFDACKSGISQKEVLAEMEDVIPDDAKKEMTFTLSELLKYW